MALKYPQLRGLTTKELTMLINDTTDLELLERAEEEYVRRTIMEYEDHRLDEDTIDLKDI